MLPSYEIYENIRLNKSIKDPSSNFIFGKQIFLSENSRKFRKKLIVLIKTTINS
jgi:hypothetical protein